MELKRFALYDDLTSLYKKTVPVARTLEDKMELFTKEQIQMKTIVQNYDKAIDMKACKTEIVRLEIAMRPFADDAEFKSFKSMIEVTLEDNKAAFNEALKAVALVQKNLENDILIQVRKATAHLRNKDNDSALSNLDAKVAEPSKNG